MTDPLARITLCPDRPAWLLGRREGIGGSDVPAILGLSPYSGATPLSVFAAKKGLVESKESTYSMRRGNHMEAMIAAEIEDAAGVGIERLFGTEEFAIARHPDAPHLAYSPDALIREPCGTLVLGEWKSQLRSAHRWEESVPSDVDAQVQHGMYVLDLPAAYVAVDLGHELKYQRVPRNPAWASAVVPVLSAWWHAFPGRNVAPPAGPGDSGVLASIYPEDFGGVVELPADLLDVSEDIEALAEQIKALEAEREAKQNAIKAALGASTRGVLPDGSGWSWKAQTRRAYEVKETTFRVLRRVGAKR